MKRNNKGSKTEKVCDSDILNRSSSNSSICSHTSKNSEEPVEDVLEMVMAEKANAMCRGKSAEYDQAFAPRIRTRGVRDVAERADEDPENSEAENAEKQLYHPAIGSESYVHPGAFRVQGTNLVTLNPQESQRDVRTDNTSPQLPFTTDNGDNIVVIARASLVRENEIRGENDVEDDLDLENSSSRPPLPIAEVLNSSGEKVFVDPKKNSTRCRRMFRWSVIVILAVIAAVLIAILVRAKTTERQELLPKEERAGTDYHGGTNGNDGRTSSYPGNE